MKRLLAALIATVLLGLSLSSVSTAGAQDSWKINTFHSDISVLETGYVDVAEHLTVDFGSNQQHGIYRTIPVTYTSRNGDLLYTEIKIKSVTQDGGSAVYTESKDSINDTIKIGDASRTVSGSHSYVIHYSVNGVLSSYDTYDEFYWNVTGNGWSVPIDNASATVTLPVSGISQYACYQGMPGSTEKCQYTTVDKTSASFTASRVLDSSEGLTVAVGYTKGLLPVNVVSQPPTGSFQIQPFIKQFIITLIIGLIALLAYTLILRRKVTQKIQTKARESRGNNLSTIAVEYEPPFGLRPGQVGGLVDQKADTLDITATIVDLAVRGYLTITEIPKTWALGNKDYLLKATDKSMDKLRPYERLLLTKLFKGRSEVKMSKLKNTFYQDLEEIKDELYQDLMGSGYLTTNPQTVNLAYRTILIFLPVAGLVTIVNGFYGTGAALIICGIISLALKKLIPELSLLGYQAIQKILGYKLFVSATERYRQPYFEKENIYLEVLPYAIVFGVTAKLAQAFKEMGLTPPQPSWYISNQPFIAFAFVNEMSNFSSQLNSSIASSPSGSGSGGAGFSGGGFGGGGGGSW